MTQIQSSLPSSARAKARAGARRNAVIRAMAVVAAIANLTGCASLGRSEASGYLDQGFEPGYGQDRREWERETVSTEMGFRGTRKLKDDEQTAVDLRIRLRQAEKTIEGRREREQYFRNKPYLKDDRERIEFLRLGSFESRQRWLLARGISGSSTRHPPDIQELVDQNDITPGMTKQAVKDAWGEPETIDVAGNPIYGNERWQYREQITSSEGYQTETRMVYFESGLVVGWEKL